MNKFDSFFSSVEHLHPSPENDEIYGVVDTNTVEFIDLANDIAEHGIREPIVVSADCYILSGHRRYQAAKLVGLREVPVRWITNIFRSDHRPEDWKRLLIAYNHQRVKSSVVRLKEAALQIDPDIAYKQLCFDRDQQHNDQLTKLQVEGEKIRSEISEGKQEMLQSVIHIIESLSQYWPLSVRQVHYQLLNDPPLRNTAAKKRQQYENNRNSYQDLCDLIARARIAGLLDWKAIADETRPVSNTRFQKDSAEFLNLQFHCFLRGYRRDLLQSQVDHIELIVEKLTVQNIVLPVAQKYCVPTTIGRGYCSIGPRREIVERYRRSGKRKLILLIVSDFDPDGDEIAESFVRSIRDDFGVVEIEASKILLRSDQATDWELPANMEAKESSGQYAKFVAKYGSKQVFELEAVAPSMMQAAVEEGIRAAIDNEAFKREVQAERTDAARLSAIKAATISFFQDSDLSELG